MIEDLKGKKVSIWGTGMGGKKMYTFLKSHAEIVCFYDSDERKRGTFLYDVPIRKWSPNEPSTYIIIASDYWREIIPELVANGLKIFKDFTIHDFLQNDLPKEYSLLCEIQECTGEWNEEDWTRYKGNKKIAVIHGGCKGTSLGVLLSLHPTFADNYIVVETPRELYINSFYPATVREIAFKYMNDVTFLQQIDLFFHEVKDAKKTWIMDQDIIMSRLNPDCKKVLMSSLRFSGYFPQCRANEKKWIPVLQLYNVRYRDKYIDTLCKEGCSADEIVKRIASEDYLSSEEVEDFMRVSLSMMELQEKKIDVKIHDYITEHGYKEQLFYDPSHPNNKVLIEYANRLIQYIFPESERKLQDIYCYDELVHSLVQLYLWKTPVYPCVAKALGLKKYEKSYRINGNTGFTQPLTLDEYIYEYIRIYFGDATTMR